MSLSIPGYDFTTCIILIIIGIVCAIISIYLRTRQDDAKFCTEHVEGTVVGGGHINYGNNFVPRCSYAVDGVTYEVDGPLFESGTTLPGMPCNCTSRANLPTKFKGPQIAEPPLNMQSNDSWYQESALYPLYPVGSPVDIYYEPGNPKHAYVQRPVRKYRVVIMILTAWAILLVALDLLLIYLSS